MDDRNTPQFTTGELLYALDGLKQEQEKIRSNMVILAGQIHIHNTRKDAENVQHNLDWITYDAMHADRLKARQRQAEHAIRILNRLVKAFNQQ